LTDIAGKNPALLTAGWNSIANAPRREHGFFDKNKKDCLGCGYCNFGCQYGRKLSMLETYVPKLTQHGRRIVVGCHAVKIDTDHHRATEVRCEMKDGRKVTVRARDSIVVSCGVIGSSVLLMKSGIKVRHHVKDLVGSRVSFNAASPLFGLYSDAVRGFDGMQMGAYIGAGEGGLTGDYLMESHFDPPMTFAASLPGWFEQHFARMKQYARFVSAGVLVRTEANGSIKSSPEARDLLGPVDYQMLPGDLAKIRRGLSEVAAAWFQSGAKVVLPSTFRLVELHADQWLNKAPADIETELSKHIKQPDDITLSSAHLQGGNPMSDEDIGVVDSQFKVKGFDNLFVCDASVFQSSVGVNPQLTIMAMADYLVGLGVL
jgi:choline dehydrogenase-like flavoprotein